jgi:hypothetical protein
VKACPGRGAAPTPTAAGSGGRSSPALSPWTSLFTALPERAETRLAGLLLAIPDLIDLGIGDMVAAAGYPSTPKIPALSYVLSLLALKLTSTRRISHVYDIAADPGAALFAGLTPGGRPPSARAHCLRCASGLSGCPGLGDLGDHASLRADIHLHPQAELTG